jgi:hypothetical protein
MDVRGPLALLPLPAAEFGAAPEPSMKLLVLLIL